MNNNTLKKKITLVLIVLNNCLNTQHISHTENDKT